MEFLAQATEEMRKLHEEIEEFDSQAEELKRKREVLLAATAEISKLKALRTRAIAENEKAYAELKQEFEGEIRILVLLDLMALCRV
jgi:prefoldin subunit 5